MFKVVGDGDAINIKIVRNLEEALNEANEYFA
jgi:hypothetical protein